MGATNKEDTDWLNFFKESPKKIIKPKEPQSKSEDISSKIPFSDDDFKHNANRRRSSSADWLGLSEAKSMPSNDLQMSKENKLSVEDDEWMVETEAVQIPFTSPHRRQKIDDSQAVDTDWLTDRNTSGIGRNKNPSKSPHILKDHLSEGSLSDINRMKASIEAENLQQTDIPKESRISSAQLQFGKAESSFQTVLPDSNRNKFAGLNSQAAFKDNYAPRNLSNDSGIKTESLKEADASIHALQTIINNHVLEKDQLLKSSEAIKLMYEERIKTLEMLQKVSKDFKEYFALDQLKASEDSFKVMETKLKSEIEEKVKNYEEKLNAVEQEKKSLEQNVKAKQEEIGKENLKEIKRLKELHEQSITLMKQDHEEALLRLKRLKEQEIEALLSTQSHSKSLQHLTEQLEARTAELASLQVKLEGRNQATMRDKQALLDAKERDLRSLQNRLQKQLENSDDERDRLQQLVLKLESRLQKYAAEGEEDRWEVQKMKARLSVQQKHLDEEYKLQMQQVEREKEKLRLSQDSLLHEQKVILVQLAQERQQLMQEKVEMESLSKKIKEEEAKFHIKVLKEESFIEKQKQFIQQEQNKMNFEKTSAKQELQFFEQEKDALLMERQMLKEEKIKLNELNYKLRRKENELEIMLMAATDDKERGQAEHTAALKIKAEQQSREQQITQKMQELMEKEHQILSKKLTEERFELEKKKNSVLCNKCKLSLGHPIHAPTTSVHYAPVSTTPISTPFLNGISNPLVPPHPDPSLVVWYITAQKK
ncbi:fas-binding factor 1 [Caerostris extrusa]|uniref:Fas-binding factor 1 n=1 Tax=Caerostris extrusa TaxID=172846 RepID=A0AAV4RX13_CAEEX|nr:fas-binding factor 1 [Caerostris extrusa]